MAELEKEREQSRVATQQLQILQTELLATQTRAEKLQESLLHLQQDRANFEQLAASHLDNNSDALRLLTSEQAQIKEKLIVADQAIASLNTEKEEGMNRLKSSLQNIKEYEELVTELRAVVSEQEALLESQAQSISNFDSSATSQQDRSDELRLRMKEIETANGQLKEDLLRQSDGEGVLRSTIDNLNEEAISSQAALNDARSQLSTLRSTLETLQQGTTSSNVDHEELVNLMKNQLQETEAR